jgi:hypothetical protein
LFNLLTTSHQITSVRICVIDDDWCDGVCDMLPTRTTVSDHYAKVLWGGERCLGKWTVIHIEIFLDADAIFGRRENCKDAPRLLN